MIYVYVLTSFFLMGVCNQAYVRGVSFDRETQSIHN